MYGMFQILEEIYFRIVKIFKKADVYQFLKDGELKMIEKRRKNGHYALEMNVHVPKEAAEVFVASKEDTLQLWHEHLCHQNNKNSYQQGISVK